MGTGRHMSDEQSAESTPGRQRAGEFLRVGGSPVPGLRLRRLLRSRTDFVKKILWAPHGRRLAYGGHWEAVHVLDTQSWTEVAKLPGSGVCLAWSPEGDALASTEGVWREGRSLLRPTFSGVGDGHCMAWSPDGQLLAVGHANRITLLHAVTGEDLGQLSVQHTGMWVESLLWSQDGRVLIAAVQDGLIECWDAERRAVVQRLQNSSDPETAHSLTWLPDGVTLVSGHENGLLRVWDVAAGALKVEIEAHTGWVSGLDVSPHGLLASKSADGTVGLWNTTTFAKLATLSEAAAGTDSSENFLAGLAFHPQARLLATAGEAGKALRIWEFDDRLLAEQAEDQVNYATAKLVLVGDSGVGKTGLGWRLARGEFKEHASTHGQQFWVIPELAGRPEGDVKREAVLWDLAGQHVYRQIHSIFLDDVAVALVVFDPSNRQDPFKGIEFWLEQLKGKGRLPPVILVGARLDRGTLTFGRDEIDRFCQKHHLSGGYIGTSALTGEGLAELLERVSAEIRWETTTATITTVTFKRIKDHALALKEGRGHRVLVTPSELRRELESGAESGGRSATVVGAEFSDAELMTALGHLQNHGYLSLLRDSTGADHVLLAPDLLVNVAASIMLLADNNARELGSVNEAQLLAGELGIPELAELKERDRRLLLDAAVLRFLSHKVCFRETLNHETLLIFPGLIKQKRPLGDSFDWVEDTTYTIRGRVENIYASMVVLLGYSSVFTRINQWHNQAQYEINHDEICGFRLVEEREGELEIVLYFSTLTPDYGRSLFRGLFENFLYQRDVQIVRVPPVHCGNGHRIERATVLKRMREAKAFIFCDECGERITLPEVERPQKLGQRLGRAVERADALAHLRGTYETSLTRIKSFRSDRLPPRCFLSRPDTRDHWVEALRNDLHDAGIVTLDSAADLRDGDFLLAVCASGPEAASGADVPPGVAVRTIPLLLEGHPQQAIPDALQDYAVIDFRDPGRYVVNLLDLVLGVYVISPDHPAFKPIRETLHQQWRDGVERYRGNGQVFISYAWGGESEAIVDDLERELHGCGVIPVRDKNDLRYTDSVKDFMRGLAQGKAIVVVVSDRYLRSANCCFELLHMSKDPDWRSRIFPIVLDDARIYDAASRLEYVRYWEQQYEELEGSLKGVASHHLGGLREDADLYAEIRTALPSLLEVLGDLNALPADAHRRSRFKELMDAIVTKLD